MKDMQLVQVPVLRWKSPSSEMVCKIRLATMETGNYQLRAMKTGSYQHTLRRREAISYAP